MTDIMDSALFFINPPLSSLVQIRIDTDILRNGIRLDDSNQLKFVTFVLYCLILIGLYVVFALQSL